MSNVTVTVTVEEDGNDVFIEIPQDILNTLSLTEGDTINWNVDGDGVVSITKEPEYLDEPIQLDLFDNE